MQTRYAQQYEQLWRSHWWWQARKRFVLTRLQQLHRQDPPRPTPRRILDIGCGNGLFFDDLNAFGDVRGIEPDATLVAEDGPHQSRIQVRGFDETYTPPENGEPFNWILMLDVLEHLQDDHAAARHVHQLLAPGGFFLLTVPALQFLWSEHDEANLHFRRYTKRALRKVLVDAGFTIHRLNYFFGWTIAPMLLRRFIAPGTAYSPRLAGGNAGQSHSPSDHTFSAPGFAGGMCDSTHKSTPSPYQVKLPPPLANAAMFGLTRLEQTTFGRWGLPLGSSLIAVARKGG